MTLALFSGFLLNAGRRTLGLTHAVPPKTPRTATNFAQADSALIAFTHPVPRAGRVPVVPESFHLKLKGHAQRLSSSRVIPFRASLLSAQRHEETAPPTSCPLAQPPPSA